jgi:hypothetical protein
MENNRFENILNELPEGRRRDRIKEALQQSDIQDEGDLGAIVAGNTKAEVTSLFKEELQLSGLDASALAGVLVSQSGKVFLLLACTI